MNVQRKRAQFDFIHFYTLTHVPFCQLQLQIAVYGVSEKTLGHTENFRAGM